METVLHVDDADSFWKTPHVYASIRIVADSVATVHETDLPIGWNIRPVTRVSQNVGDEWLDGLLSPVLAVPSIFTPEELRYEQGYLNYVLNPKHPRFASSVELGTIRNLSLT